jgi:hypothetical protein
MRGLLKTASAEDSWNDHEGKTVRKEGTRESVTTNQKRVHRALRVALMSRWNLSTMPLDSG